MTKFYHQTTIKHYQYIHVNEQKTKNNNKIRNNSDKTQL